MKALTTTSIRISVFDMFETGPGPSSSHTIGPMKAAYNFWQCCQTLPADIQRQARRVRVRLLGSLSATGAGHGTDRAIIAGLLGQQPVDCPPNLLADIESRRLETTFTMPSCPPLPLSMEDVEHGEIVHDKPYSNTLIIELLGSGSSLDSSSSGSPSPNTQACPPILFSREYYSVGGGFIQWKGWQAEERGLPLHPYTSMGELQAISAETGFSLHEIILRNEGAITGDSRPCILQRLQSVIDAMEASVERGLAKTGVLPGTLGLHRKAKALASRATALPSPLDTFLCRLNAYAFAVAEENADGGVIVTAPTCGAAGVMPAILWAMRHDLNIGDRAVREGVLASAAVGFLAKHNAGIAGAEVGCQGEVGVASSMAAAMLAHARGYAIPIVANAAEIALEHHLGLTCDPVGGYVQIPCIERNAVGAVKAYNACLVARCEDPHHHLVSLDSVISAMAEIGRDMNAKFKETSAGGLAVSFVAC